MTDAEKLALYRQALSQIVFDAGGHIKLPPATPDFLECGGTLMNRVDPDGGIEFRYVQDGVGYVLADEMKSGPAGKEK